MSVHSSSNYDNNIVTCATIVETTVANRNGGFILCQVLPSDRYSHYLHNEYVAYTLVFTLRKDGTAHDDTSKHKKFTSMVVCK